MATKKMVKDMITLFSGIWQKSINPEIYDAYYEVLKGYDDDAVQKAGYKCMEGCQFFPKPADIISKIYVRREKINYEKKFNLYNGHCQVCGKSGIMTMKDDEIDGLWKCRNCYTGMTNDEIVQRYENLKKLLKKMGTRCKPTKSVTTPEEKRRVNLGFDVPEGFPIMTKEQELKRRQLLLEQYQKIKSGEVVL